MYCGHISSFLFCIFNRLSNGFLVICHCMQIFNLVSIRMQIKLVILSIQTFVGQLEPAVSRFHIISSILSDNKLSLISGLFSNFCKNTLNNYAQTGISITQWL